MNRKPINFCVIVPARAGSKGVPGKNTCLIAGKPLIAYTLELVEQLQPYSFIVTSDCDQILSVSQKYGKSAYLCKRPEELATDSACATDVVIHALSKHEEIYGMLPDATILLQPTCLVRTLNQIKHAIDKFVSSEKSSLVSISEPHHHPSDCLYQDEEQWRFCFKRSKTEMPRQSFHPAWFINGSIYIVKTEYFLKNKKFYELADTCIYKMPRECGIDIDEPFDILLAETYFNRQSKECTV